MVKDEDSIIFIVNGSCIGSNSQHCFVYKGVTVLRVILVIYMESMAGTLV